MYRPLHIAAKSGLVGVVKDLINRGADLNVRDAEGMITNNVNYHPVVQLEGQGGGPLSPIL